MPSPSQSSSSGFYGSESEEHSKKQRLLSAAWHSTGARSKARSPVVDHASVVIEALVVPAPVVSDQVQVEVVGGDRRFPVAHLLEGPFTEEQRRRTCDRLPGLRLSLCSTTMIATYAQACTQARNLGGDAKQLVLQAAQKSLTQTGACLANIAIHVRCSIPPEFPIMWTQDPQRKVGPSLLGIWQCLAGSAYSAHVACLYHAPKTIPGHDLCGWHEWRAKRQSAPS